ncbi:MAG: histidine phosphatase family protein [Gemmatimonadales bacterium]
MAEPPQLVLIRHGETESNRTGRFAGWSDEHLTEEGRKGVVRLARNLALRGGRLYTSPVRRAVETAEILAAELSLPVHTVHDLHEIELGEWTGLTESEVAERWPSAYRQWLERPDQLIIPGRERLDEVRERAVEAIDQIGKAELSEDGAPVVVITHLALIRVLWLTANDRPLAEYHSVTAAHDKLHVILWEGRGRLTPVESEPWSPSTAN